ncbi:MAG: protein TolR [Desulfovibrionaceae bacterium]|jgi:biopolymer transport protein TolR|nr:protein TolR [Desulfovibrionaceae bacterium]
MAGISPQKGYIAEINVTPFVDVMLVLLIIFMVTAPLLTQGLDVELPQTRAVDALPADNDSIVLSVKANGDIYLDEYEVALDELAGHVQRLVTEKNKRLFLQADKSVPYGEVVRIMGEVKSAGVTNLGVVAEREEQDGKASSKGAKKK